MNLYSHRVLFDEQEILLAEKLNYEMIYSCRLLAQHGYDIHIM